MRKTQIFEINTKQKKSHAQQSNLAHAILRKIVEKIVYLAGIAIHHAHVLAACPSLQDDLLHVLPDHPEALRGQVLVANNVEKLDNVAQQLLGNALARGVDAELHRRRSKQNGRRKHTHTNRLAKAPRRRNQHLRCQVLPAVELQHLLVVPRKLARWLRLPERPRARLLFYFT